MKWIAIALLSSGCIYSRAAEIPMGMEVHSAGASPKGAVVMLPGLGDDPDKFVKHGFVKKVNDLGWDAVTVDAHFGYYRERILGPRLEEDVIGKLKQKGYRQIWLVGISLGGFGSVIYSVEHSAEVAGMIVLSPFLGNDGDWQPIESAGGLSKWEPGDLSTITDQDARALCEMWTWLRGYATGEARPPLFLAYGNEDRFVRPDSLLAGALPPEHVVVISGGHKWTTWDLAFDALIGRALSSARPAEAAAR